MKRNRYTAFICCVSSLEIFNTSQILHNYINYVITDAPPPDQVTNVNFDMRSIISWNVDSTGTQIDYIYNVTITPPLSTGLCSAGFCLTNETWINITSLNSSVAYTVTIEAINNCGRSNKRVATINCNSETSIMHVFSCLKLLDGN